MYVSLPIICKGIMEHLELSLDHILCGIREARLMTPFDIRRLWGQVVENLLENGFYENERLEDAINNTNFKGWHSDSTYIHPELSLEDLFRVLDAIEEVPQINVPYISTREY